MWAATVCTYLLPKQDVGTSHISVDATQLPEQMNLPLRTMQDRSHRRKHLIGQLRRCRTFGGSFFCTSTCCTWTLCCTAPSCSIAFCPCKILGGQKGNICGTDKKGKNKTSIHRKESNEGNTCTLPTPNTGWACGWVDFLLEKIKCH